MKRVLVIGGYGNFGSFISKTLAGEENLKVFIGGRSIEKANALINVIDAKNKPDAVRLDINENLEEVLTAIKPDLVIHTSGPFQNQGYEVAELCVSHGVNYIDLADGRDFVADVTKLDVSAKEKGVFVISGASSVPCLTAALVDHYKDEFEILESLDYGITTAQKTARGLATTAAILGYTGQKICTLVNGRPKVLFGWQGFLARKYKNIGWRLLGNCDIPDLSLFPKRYPELKTIRFYAGLEISFIHIALWGLSWLVRFGLIKSLQKAAPLLLRLSYLFDWLGSSNSAFHMVLSGIGKGGEIKSVSFELTAGSGDGPYIPCMPAILLGKMLVGEETIVAGARPCVGIITKDQYLEALGTMDISWEEN